MNYFNDMTEFFQWKYQVTEVIQGNVWYLSLYPFCPYCPISYIKIIIEFGKPIQIETWASSKSNSAPTQPEVSSKILGYIMSLLNVMSSIWFGVYVSDLECYSFHSVWIFPSIKIASPKNSLSIMRVERESFIATSRLATLVKFIVLFISNTCMHKKIHCTRPIYCVKQENSNMTLLHVLDW